LYFTAFLDETDFGNGMTSKILNLHVEKFYLLEYNIVQSTESQPMFRRQHSPPKRGLTFNGLHSTVPQKTETFTATSVRTSNPTYVD
jgi:hypothetical protein